MFLRLAEVNAFAAAPIFAPPRTRKAGEEARSEVAGVTTPTVPARPRAVAATRRLPRESARAPPIGERRHACDAGCRSGACRALSVATTSRGRMAAAIGDEAVSETRASLPGVDIPVPFDWKRDRGRSDRA